MMNERIITTQEIANTVIKALDVMLKAVNKNGEDMFDVMVSKDYVKQNKLSRSERKNIKKLHNILRTTEYHRWGYNTMVRMIRSYSVWQQIMFLI